MNNQPNNQQDPNQKKAEKQTTQAHLPIADIREGVVVLKDSSMRTVLIVSTVNFDLKNEDEQNALIYAYQNFLNSLEFPIQIVMQSRRLDLTAYLAKLESRFSQMQNPLLRLQTENYIIFIRELLKIANIMKKRFFVVVPYYPPLLKKEDFMAKLKSSFGSKNQQIDMTHFVDYKKELLQRTNVVAQHLASFGLRAVQLSTQELIELMYQTYNPELAIREKLSDVGQLRQAVVSGYKPADLGQQ